jgi:hypothetical protein
MVASFVMNFSVFCQPQSPSPFSTGQHPEPGEFTPKRISLKSSTAKQLQPISLLSSVPHKKLVFISKYTYCTILDLFALHECLGFSTADNRAMKMY